MRRTPRKRLIWTVFVAVLLLSSGSALARPRVDVTVKSVILQSPTQNATVGAAIDRPDGPKPIPRTADASFTRGQAEDYESVIAAVKIAAAGKLLGQSASVESIYGEPLVDQLLYKLVFLPLD